MESEQAKSLAHAVRACAELEAKFALVKKDYNQRIEAFQQTIYKLSNDILTGQGELPLEGATLEAAAPPPSPVTEAEPSVPHGGGEPTSQAVRRAQESMQRIAEQDKTQIVLQVEGRPPVVIADGTKPKRRSRPAPPASGPTPF